MLFWIQWWIGSHSSWWSSHAVSKWLIPSATRDRARLPICLSRFHVIEIRCLLFRCPSRDGDSTLSDLYPGPDISDHLLFRQEFVDFGGSDGFGGIFVYVSLMHTTSSNSHTSLPRVLLVCGVGNGRSGLVFLSLSTFGLRCHCISSRRALLRRDCCDCFLLIPRGRFP